MGLYLYTLLFFRIYIHKNIFSIACLKCGKLGIYTVLHRWISNFIERRSVEIIKKIV
jgi:hypothetical protein